MPPPKVVLVARFEIPPEPMLPRGPEHKIQHDFTADRVRCAALFRRMNPLRANAQHKLRLFREGPRLLEQKVGVPFRRVTGEKPCNSCLKFQPVLYWRNFNRGGRAEARAAVFDIDIPASSSPQLDNCGWLLFDRLREGVSSAEEQRCYQHGPCRVHSMAPPCNNPTLKGKQ